MFDFLLKDITANQCREIATNTSKDNLTYIIYKEIVNASKIGCTQYLFGIEIPCYIVEELIKNGFIVQNLKNNLCNQTLVSWG